ncbi:MAG: AMP-binding protein, partial [Actinobacteria bacterium]|nr:AMP-binding protein [Actinomycetota bacterium]
MKKLRIGRRAQRGELPSSPLELALYPAIADGHWQVPDRFNFTRDVVEALAHDPKRQAVTMLGKDGVIEPRSFLQLAERSARWSSLLRERGVRPGDRVLVLVGTNVDWLEIVLACLKVGAVVVPAPVTMSAATLEDRMAATGARLIVATRTAEPEIVRMVERPHVLYVDEAQPLLLSAPEQAPTHDSSPRDLAFVLTSAGTSGGPHLVAHTNASAFAARVAAEYWLDAGRGDAVWSTAPSGSPNSVWHALLGPWSRGAETLLHEGEFEPLERLDLIYRFGTTILNQTPAEYAALAQHSELGRFRPPQLRRLVSTGDYLDPEVSAVFEETWGLVIHDGYSQAETNVFVGNGAEAGFKPGSLGLPLPGHQVAVIDEGGHEVPPGAEGELAVRARTPTLFAGYWEAPDETKEAFRGDWYTTGDIATADADGFLWFLGRAADMLTSRGERFSPSASERALRLHDAITASAVVGVRDLERGGQFLRAFVVLAPGVEGSVGLEAEIRQDVGQSLAEHEVPREIEFVDELPTTSSGKVRRLELRERLIVGRPLWEMPPTTELEPGFLEPAEPTPAWDSVVGGWTLPGTAAELVEETETERLPDYVVVPEPEPEPVAYFEAFEPTPVVELTPEPDPVVETQP